MVIELMCDSDETVFGDMLVLSQLSQIQASGYWRWKVAQVIAILVVTLRHQLGSFVE